MSLNGKKLELVNDVTFPEMHTKVVGAGSRIIFLVQIYGSIVIAKEVDLTGYQSTNEVADDRGLAYLC